MLNNLLKIGSAFDWISPTISALQGMFGGMGGVVFTPPLGMSGNDVAAVFRCMGLKTGAGMVDTFSDDVHIMVSDPDCAYRIVDGLHNGAIWVQRSWTGKVKAAGWAR